MDEKRFPKRKPNRLRYFDYSSPGAYFITLCTNGRKCTLSRIVGAIHESPEIQLTEWGVLIDDEIKHIQDRFQAVIDCYVIMPNHIHLIIRLPYRAEENTLQSARSEISKIVGLIKMQTSKKIHKNYPNEKIWQRSFHDHVIRNRSDYEKIAAYIRDNPLKWKSDCFYIDIAGDS